jgi:hypothetical protein
MAGLNGRRIGRAARRALRGEDSGVGRAVPHDRVTGIPENGPLRRNPGNVSPRAAGPDLLRAVLASAPSHSAPLD